MNNEFKKTLARVASLILLVLLGAGILCLSKLSYTFSDPALSLLKLSIKHTSKRVVECDETALLKERAEMYKKMLKETKRARMKIEKLGECSRERHPIYVELFIGGKKKLEGTYKPGGLRNDGPSFAYGNFKVTPGTRNIIVKLRDSGKVQGFDYVLDETVSFEPGYVHVIEFKRAKGGLYLR
jgi:hypothetical protein